MRVIHTDCPRPFPHDEIGGLLAVLRHVGRRAVEGAGAALAGAITETIFNYQGLGCATVNSVQVVTFTIVILTSFVANLVMDFFCGVIDPRVRYQE